MGDFLTADDLVTRWGGVVNKGTLANWRSQNRGPAYVKIGHRVVYPLDQVEIWEKANLKKANDNKR